MNKIFRTIYHEIRMNIMIAKSYKFSFILDMVIFFGLLSFMILSDSGYMLSVYYNKKGDMVNSKELLLIAYVMWIISNSVITTLTNEVRLENLRGTLEYKLMAIVPFEFLIMSQVLSSFLIQIIEAIIVIALSKIIFKINLILNFKIILFGLIIIIGMYGLSLVIGAIVLNKKKIGQLTLIIQVALLFLSNIFTISKLGIISKLIPLGIGNHILRLEYAKISIPIGVYLEFVGCCIAWLIIGKILFSKAIYNTKTKGSLGLY